MHAFSLNMGLHHRHLLDSPSDCVKACAEKKPPPSCTPCAPPPPPPPYIYDSPKQHIETKYLIISFSIVAAAFIVLCLYAIYVKFLSPRRNRNRNRSITRTTLSHPQAEQDFLDEEQEQEQEQEQNGPVVDHHIWYIRTAGLQPAVVAAITVCKYKKDEGLIEGTECSVCLSEFQEEESVRLLPKCNHAFHLPCIDTWLGSHTNCPMCRAPIVTDPARVPSMDPTAFSSSSNFVQEVLENSDEEEEERAVQEVQVCETETETENSASEVVTLQQPRRSVSLDSSSAAKISLALATVVSEESHGNHSKRVVATKGGSSSTSSVKRSRSFNAKHLLSLYGYGRSQRKPNPPLRSF